MGPKESETATPSTPGNRVAAEGIVTLWQAKESRLPPHVSVKTQPCDGTHWLVVHGSPSSQMRSGCVQVPAEHASVVHASPSSGQAVPVSGSWTQACAPSQRAAVHGLPASWQRRG